MPVHHQSQQPPHRARHDEEGPPPPTVAYNGGPGSGMPEHPRQPRSLDDGHAAPALARQPSNNGFLAIGEINRKGRVSPLPQAVQGAQPQSMTPSGEPGIKSEFGRMFSGIGTGAGAFGMPSPGPSHLPFTNSGLARREDAEPPAVDAVAEAPAKQPRKRQRKVKDDDHKGDDDSTGRLTPVGRSKRARTNHAHHHHQYVHTGTPRLEVQNTDNAVSSHHHHHHHGIPERTASPLHAGSTPLKNVKTGTPVLSPTGLPMTHNHQIPRSNSGVAPAKQAPQAPVVFTKPKKTVSSQLVLDSVAHKPRKHLGDILYEPYIKADHFRTHSKGGFRTKPKPLPRDQITDNENSTLTVKIHRRHLEPHCREELTRNRAVWGTDVYTDDSDVIAACIHAGWFRGEWADDVDTSLLGLERTPPKGKGRGTSAGEKGPQDILTSPPATGPMHVPLDRDLHVTILVLPNLVKYAGSTRFGIMSREFGGSYKGRKSIHDGLSFKIEQIRWVDGAAPQSRLRGKARRERIRKAMSEVDRSQVIDIGDLKKADKPAETAAPNGDMNKENRPLGVESASPAQEMQGVSPGKPAEAQGAQDSSMIDAPASDSDKMVAAEPQAAGST
ncbi:hypothetical protein KJ359_002440 [Pestalotiopsis sp. 9143b]|nr:hypothetical protein KJ359_002440 [Pestalotiopsis sp. 9143b]